MNIHKIFHLLAIASITACANAQTTPLSTLASEPISLPYPEPDAQSEQAAQLEYLNQQITQLTQQVEQLQTRVHQLEQRATPPRHQPKPRLSAQNPIPPISGSLKNIPTLSSAEIKTLQTAQAQFKQGDYRAAAHTLRHADSGGNGSENARQAMHLLLQSQQKLGNCQSVINIGQRYAMRFPSSPSAAEALFFVGDCQWRIQQQDIAQDTWRSLMRQYPNSLAARRAATRLNAK